MKTNTLKYLPMILLLIPVTTFADDTAFGGSGAAPMPITNNSVAMLSEKIIISGNDLNNPNMQGNWSYECNFVFKNNSEQPKSFTMGFPLPIYQGESDAAVPQGQQAKVGAPLVYNFQVEVNGHTVDTKKVNLSANTEKNLNYKEAYIWPITFVPYQTINIHHSYITGVTTQVMGYNWVSYVVRTGGLWQNGTIGHAVIEVVPNTPTRLCTEVDKDAANYATPQPAGMKIVGNGSQRKYVWDITNFQPTQDVNLCLQTGKNYIRYHFVYPIINGAKINNKNLKDFSPAQLRYLRNAIYAQYGKTFSDPILQKNFNQQWWYETNSNYSDSMLTSDDAKAIAILQSLENAK